MPPTYGRPLDLNRTAIFENTSGVRASRPIHVGAYSRSEERENLRSSYSLFHNYKKQVHNRRFDIMSKPSSLRLLSGTNEYAEDLTGQREPLNASRWQSETRAQYDGFVMRPTSAPVRRVVSLMDNQEPVFGKTHQYRDPQLKDVYPHKPIPPTKFQHRDMYQTSYSFNHRRFANAEMQAASHWKNGPDRLPWLQDPTTEFKLQCRVPVEPADQRLHPTEAQLATLPHYTDPLLKLGNTENQMSYSDPYNQNEFYFEEPNKVKRPIVQHLERSFVN